MIYQKLVDVIEENADKLAKRLVKDLLGREETKGYRILSDEKLYTRVRDVYSNLGSWLDPEKHTSGEIKKVYTELGKKRYREGIPLNEVILAFMLVKRHLWLYVRETQFFDTAFEIYQALELNNKVVQFFDRVVYFVTMGYEEELRKAKG